MAHAVMFGWFAFLHLDLWGVVSSTGKCSKVVNLYDFMWSSIVTSKICVVFFFFFQANREIACLIPQCIFLFWVKVVPRHSWLQFFAGMHHSMQCLLFGSSVVMAFIWDLLVMLFISCAAHVRLHWCAINYLANYTNKLMSSAKIMF